MRFSIITVTFNAEKYLAETLTSTASQTFDNFEHILWDGGSTDDTLDIAKSFSHVKIYTGKDCGISDAMNKGAELAKGEFILHLHADDHLIHPHVLKQVDTAIKTHPCEWLYGQVKTLNQMGEENLSPFVSFCKQRLKKYNIISHPACFLSRERFFERGRFDIKLRYCMDYDLWLRCAQVIIPYALASPLAVFRQHVDSLSTSQPLAVADEAFAVRNRYIKGIWSKRRSLRTWKRRRKEILQ